MTMKGTLRVSSPACGGGVRRASARMTEGAGSAISPSASLITFALHLPRERGRKVTAESPS